MGYLEVISTGPRSHDPSGGKSETRPGIAWRRIAIRSGAEHCIGAVAGRVVQDNGGSLEPNENLAIVRAGERSPAGRYRAQRGFAPRRRARIWPGLVRFSCRPADRPSCKASRSGFMSRLGVRACPPGSEGRAGWGPCPTFFRISSAHSPGLRDASQPTEDRLIVSRPGDSWLGAELHRALEPQRPIGVRLMAPIKCQGAGVRRHDAHSLPPAISVRLSESLIFPESSLLPNEAQISMACMLLRAS